MLNHKCSMRQLVLLSIAIALVNLGFSAYANARARELTLISKSLCTELQSKGFVRNCQEGSPWAFEVVRHKSQFEFEPTAAEIFKCYTVSDGHTHVPCTFKGSIKQFAGQEDLHSGLRHIQQQNYHDNKQEDLNANVTRADTTLEHYIFYKNSTEHVLIILPVTENMLTLLSVLTNLGFVEVDE
jgi:hypothetical protein